MKNYFFEKKTINGKTYQFVPRWNNSNKTWQLILVQITD